MADEISSEDPYAAVIHLALLGCTIPPTFSKSPFFFNSASLRIVLVMFTLLKREVTCSRSSTASSYGAAKPFVTPSCRARSPVAYKEASFPRCPMALLSTAHTTTMSHFFPYARSPLARVYFCPSLHMHTYVCSNARAECIDLRHKISETGLSYLDYFAATSPRYSHPRRVCGASRGYRQLYRSGNRKSFRGRKL